MTIRAARRLLGRPGRPPRPRSRPRRAAPHLCRRRRRRPAGNRRAAAAAGPGDFAGLDRCRYKHWHGHWAPQWGRRLWFWPDFIGTVATGAKAAPTATYLVKIFLAQLRVHFGSKIDYKQTHSHPLTRTARLSTWSSPSISPFVSPLTLSSVCVCVHNVQVSSLVGW